MQNLNDGRGGSIDCTRNLINIISKQKTGLRICHINAQSLKNKMDELRHIFEGSLIDVICVSESWLVPNLNNGLFSIRGFKLFRCDRSKRMLEVSCNRGNVGGGVAIYVRECYKCRVVCKSDNAELFEYLLLNINNENKSMLIGCVYRPYNSISLQPFYDKFKDISTNFTDILITGDFNSNVLIEKTLVDDMLSHGMHIVNDKSPTHFSRTSSTLLDLFFTSQKQNILLFDQISAPNFSKHDLIMLIYDFNCKKTPDSYTFRDFKNIDNELLMTCMNFIDWDQIYFMTSIDDKVAFLESCLNELFNCFVPLKTVKLKNNGNPWFTVEIKQKIVKRNLVYNRWKRYRLPEDYILYKRIKKELAKSIKIAKMTYYERKFNEALGSKQTWKCIKEIGIGKQELHVNDLVNLNELNRKFAGISNCDIDSLNCDNSSSNCDKGVSVCDNGISNCDNCILNVPVSSQHCDILRDTTASSSNPVTIVNNPTNNCDIKFSFKNVFSDEVYKSIMSINSNSTGLDNINPIFLKKILHIVLSHITHIFNCILTTSVFPKSWKRVKITPIPKSDKEFRPIAILSVLSKALEKIMSQQMSDFLIESNLLTAKQSGFRPKRSCITALIKVCEDLRKSVDINEVVFLLLLDFSKAFDNVSHRQLLKKLRRLFHFSDSAVKLIGSYLTDRLQTVCSGNEFSGFIKIFKGVPQGSVLGPLLFSLYVNDLPDILQGCSMHMYADDVQLYSSCKINSMCQCVVNINNDLRAVTNWARENDLCLNPAKTKYIVISRKPVDTCDIRLYIDDIEIELVQKAKNLGIIFNSKLSFDDHINLTVAKTYGMLRSLCVAQHYTPQKTRLLLAKTYLLPKLMYGCELFANLDHVCLRKVRVLCNNITRYVFNRKRYESVSLLTHQIFGPSLKCYLNSRSLILMHKIIYTKEPEYLFQQLRFLRSERHNNIINIRYNYLISERHFFVNTIRLWNQLPHNLKNIRNADSFKNKLNLHFLSTAASGESEV